MSCSSSSLHVLRVLVFIQFLVCVTAGESLKLSIRKDSDERDVNIRLSFRALGLVVWLGMGIILLYEILSVLFLLLRRRLCSRWMRNNNSVLMVDPPPVPSLQVYLSLLWGISTAYGIFYSFEMIFLYINDRWYALLQVQLMFTLTDVYVWIWMVAHIKYGLSLRSTSWTCVLIKFNHLLFNILIERGIWTGRHFMFCMEDATCLLMAPAVFGVSLKSLSKPLLVSGTITLLFVAVSHSRIT